MITSSLFCILNVTLIMLVIDYLLLYNKYVACKEKRTIHIFLLFICLAFMNSLFCHLTIYGDMMKMMKMKGIT